MGEEVQVHLEVEVHLERNDWVRGGGEAPRGLHLHRGGVERVQVQGILLYFQQYSKILAVITETWSDHWTFFTF